MLPTDAAEYYGFPPSKQYVFAPTPGFSARGRGFAPLFSFAAGGLAEAWTGGAYPFDDGELADWPFGWRELAPYYGRVAGRIGVSGSADDDLGAHFPAHEGLQPPLPLDDHGRDLIARYAAQREPLQRRRVKMGRARIAAASRPLGRRPACHACGRCQWGCPTDAFYTPAVTLEALRDQPGFEYVTGHRATHLELDGGGSARACIALRTSDGTSVRLEAERIVLAAGALPSAAILLETLRLQDGHAPELPGLMDNRQVLMPFVNVRRLGRRFDSATYQYHQLAMAYDPGTPAEYVHGLVTTLTTALVHPVVQSLPFGLRTSLAVFRDLHAALALLNVNFADHRRDQNRVALEADGRGGQRLFVAYEPAADEPERVRRALRALRGALLRMGCIAPPPMTRLRPMGASVHYAGTLPMCESGGDFTTDAHGRSRAIPNLWLGDGTGFPSLPAKNLTFTLMANATRIAEEAF